MTTQADYQKLRSRLVSKRAEYRDLSSKHDTLLDTIEVFNMKKNAILELLAASTQHEDMGADQELERLQQLDKDHRLEKLIQLAKGEIKPEQVEADPVLLYLMTNESV